MDLNPEFRRNLWLELSVHRMVAMPALLVLVLALVYTASERPLETVAIWCAWIAGGLGIWGARNAADAVMEEVRGRTWDGQRMSAIGPWAMSWGKLFGASAFAWYGALMALAVLVLAAPRWPQSGLKIAAVIMAGSVLAQGTACLAGLIAARKGSVRQGALSALLLFLLLVLLGPGIGLFGDADRAMNWWRQSWQTLNFMLATFAVFAAWSIFGVYRVMCTQLQVRTTPWAFAAFALFLTAFLAGFWVVPGAPRTVGLYAVIATGLVVCAMLTYLQLFSEQSGVIVFRRLQLRLARREWRRALEETPCWIAGLALAAVFSVLGMVLIDPSLLPRDLRELGYAPLPVLLMLMRDVALFLVFAFAWQPRRTEAAVFFYLVLLYGILPGLLKGAGLDAAAELLLPPILTAPGKASIIAAVHLAIAAALVAWRWRAYHRREALGEKAG
jgi:hypothetical protein